MLTVVKLGGNVIDNEVQLAAFLADFAKIEGPKILVHGGGKIASSIGTRLGIEPNYVDGRRITDAQTLELVTMVYGGLINKNVVAQLQSFGCNAIGLTGADGNVIQATKRPIKEVDYGFVGDVNDESIDAVQLNRILSAGLVPVMAPLTHDGSGNMLNTNADTIAQEIAKAMSRLMPVQLLYCFEKNGVLLDVENDERIIEEIPVADFERLKTEGVITGGMLPKLQNACTAISYGVSRVVIGNSKHLSELVKGTAGTKII